MPDLKKYITHWNLTGIGNLQKTKTGIVVEALWSGMPCILKISQDNGDEQTASVLRHYDGYGAVNILAESGEAALLECAQPGVHLSELVSKGRDEQATEIICDVIQKLHSKKLFSGNYKSVADLQSGFSRYLESQSDIIPRELVQKAKDIYQELASSQSAVILLHGDLHHDNVLFDHGRGWLAIDPKGYIGEPCYEVGAMLRNPLNFTQLCQDPNILERRMSIITERLGFDRERVIGWAFSQAVLASIWCIEDRESPEWFLKVAKRLE